MMRINIILQAYSPLGSPGTKWIESDVLQNPVLITAAEKLGKTPGQVALRWGLQMGQTVLPKSTKDHRIKENFDVFGWSIPDDIMAKFSEIAQASILLYVFYLYLLMVNSWTVFFYLTRSYFRIYLMINDKI